MLNKIKKFLVKLYMVLKVSFITLAVLFGLVFGVVVLFMTSYTQGQMDSCNFMLRNHPQTVSYGLYCEMSPKGVLVRSTEIKSTVHNITLNKTYIQLLD